ncbi:hypothetical protein JIR001_27590 [Polycladomyces abyssicola]|uniref:Amine oxidase domain-containing protein n=1 Tax=Polycladomyces abyssicola TaxID=1125966 RepID=A0A8D5UG70_9BACL|nr:hypothetical protein JIR001_27590 [Polycladomyces abyssicola]
MKKAPPTGAVQSWDLDPYFKGAFSMFKPYLETGLFPNIPVPERVHFADEHTSLTHAWIQKAIESGIRVALEVNDLPGNDQFKKSNVSSSNP